MPLLHDSGGLGYHLRAWRYRHTLWRPFHSQVHAWLSAWQPRATHLVLLGPSGGYALESEFLQRFMRVTVLEPDPLARFLLRRRFSGVAFEFADPYVFSSPDGPNWLALAWPGAAFLFCNLLGQNLVGQKNRAGWLAALEPALDGREWASWHDLVSTARPPDIHRLLKCDQAAPLDVVLAHFWAGGELHLHDHECAQLWATSPRQYTLWQLHMHQYHVVEWLYGDA